MICNNCFKFYQIVAEGFAKILYYSIFPVIVKSSFVFPKMGVQKNAGGGTPPAK